MSWPRRHPAPLLIRRAGPASKEELRGLRAVERLASLVQLAAALALLGAYPVMVLVHEAGRPMSSSAAAGIVAVLAGIGALWWRRRVWERDAAGIGAVLPATVVLAMVACGLAGWIGDRSYAVLAILIFALLVAFVANETRHARVAARLRDALDAGGFPIDPPPADGDHTSRRR
jgi:hypothetical protein